MAKATPHVWRRAASGNADKTVPGIETALIEILSTGGLPVSYTHLTLPTTEYV